VFEHDDGVGAFWERRTGHNLERGAGYEWCRGSWFTRAEAAGNREPITCGERCSLDGVAIARGAVEGREIAIGADGLGEDAVERFQKREALGLSRNSGREALRLFEDEGSGFGVGEDGVHLGFIVRL
jgi:hypothetical protein